MHFSSFPALQSANWQPLPLFPASLAGGDLVGPGLLPEMSGGSEEGPFYALQATASGMPSPAETGAAAAVSPEGLHFLFIAPPGHHLRAGESVAALIDPVGDLEGFFEIGIDAAGALYSAVLRRTRSGYKRHSAWPCHGATAQVSFGEGDADPANRAGSGAVSGQPWLAHLFIPFLAVAEHSPSPGKGERWRLNFQRTHALGGKSTLERLPLFAVAAF